MNLDLAEPQRIMRDYLATHDVAFCCVGMGIGKTATTAVGILDRLADLQTSAALIVAPLRVATYTWPCEIAKWEQTRGIKVADIRTKEGKQAFLDGSANAYLINYESLHVVSDLLKKREGVLPYGIEVWDELTKAKSHSAKRINAFRRLPRASVRWGLTGTPTPNSLMDLFAQVRLLDDGKRLGKAFTRFRDTYFQPTDYMQYNWVPRPGAEEEIHAKIEDITLVLRSQDWLDIPDVQVVDVDVPLPADVMKRYKEFKKELLIEVDGKTLTAANAAVLILKLQQFTSGVIYDEERNHTTIHTAKIDALRKIKARPLLVAVQFRHEQDRIREAFPEAQFVEDHGSELFDRWNKGKVPMLVSHPASIGHGLNLQDGGCNLVWFSPTYNREHYEQMICRLARRGQTAETVVHRLICPGTVDEIVVEALRDKNEGENRLLEALKALKKQ